MTNRPAPMKKRIIAALIDFLIIYLFSYAIFALLSFTPLGLGVEDAAKEYNGLYDSYLHSLSMGGVVETSEGLSVSWISGITSVDLSYFQSIVSSNEHMKSLWNLQINNTLIMSLISVGLVEIIFLLIIPFFNKKGQSLGKLIVGLGVVDIRYDMFLDRKNKVYRFLTSFLIETCLLLFFFRESGPVMVMIFSPLIVATLIMTSQNRQALHDVLGHAKVIDLKTAIVFNSIEEKAAYDAKILEEKNNKKDNEEVIEEEEEVNSDEDDPFLKEDKPLELTKSSVFIISYEEEKIKDLIFEIQGITSLNPIDSKKILDNLPGLVKTGLEFEDAVKIKDTLEAVGAKVEIK